MDTDIEIKFLDNLRVEASYRGNKVLVDTSEKEGGLGEMPTPGAYFLISLATCTSLYVHGFCANRDIPTQDIEMKQFMTWDEKGGKLEKVETVIKLPKSFPAKYEKAVKRVADMCFVKKTILDPPEMELTVGWKDQD